MKFRNFIIKCFIVFLFSIFLYSCDSFNLFKVLGLSTTNYSIEIAISPLNSGIVHKNTSLNQVPSGTEISLFPIPSTGWKFSHWSGDETGSDNPLTLLITENKSVTANFIREYNLYITYEGNGHVTEEIVSDARNAYSENTRVRLTALPDEGWRFDHWTGDLSGTENPKELEIQDNSHVVAVFVEELRSEWNILVYLDGDNNLESYAIKDFNELEYVNLPSNINVYVLFDRIAGYDSTNGDWTGTRLYKVRHDTNRTAINSELIEDYGELDMSSSQTLENFLTFCQDRDPAQKTMLVLWNHGGGVFPRNMTSNSRGICWDDTTGHSAWDCLTLDEVRIALNNSFLSTNRKVNILNMDACLTQMAEMIFEWRGKIDYLIGSQEVVPGDGFDYESILNFLSNNPTANAEQFSNTIVQTYYNFYQNQSTTCSALDLSSAVTDTFINAFDEFADAMYASTDTAVIALAKHYSQNFDYTENTDLKDIADYISINSTDTSLKNAAINLSIAIVDVVLVSMNSGIYNTNAHGISILYPNALEWQNYSGANQYRNLLISQSTRWDEFISEKLINILN